MLGQFVFSTCNSAGLSVKALLRNTARGGSDDADATTALNMQVSLRILDAGVPVFERANFAMIAPGSFVELSAANCPLLAHEDRELLVIARCQRGPGEQYFAQEHQLIYESRRGRTTSLLYDQLPVAPGDKVKSSAILLLAPKVWVSRDVDTFIAIANLGDPAATSIRNSRWQIDFLAGAGQRLLSLDLDLAQNASHVVDVIRTLNGRVELTDQLRMLTVVARGETAGAAILTFLRNCKTDAVALEHSLSPHYYMDGDFARVRKEAFMFPGRSGGIT